MYWLEQSGFNTFGQTGQAKDLTDAEDESAQAGTVSIRTVSADSRYAYIPYEIERERGAAAL